MSRLIIFLVIVGVLAACGQPGTATAPAPSQRPPTLPAQTQPAPTGPIRVDLTPAQRVAIQALVEAIKVPVDQVQLISTEVVQWPDSCLGIVRLNARCMGGPVAGFRIILEANGKQYEFHTNQDGTAVVQREAAPYISFALRAPDNSIHIIDTQVPIDPRPMQVTTGLLPPAGEVGGAVYALDFANQSQAVIRDQAGSHPLDFIHNPSYGLAVWSGDQPRLGWATAPVNENEPSRLFSSSVDGTALTTLLTETSVITAPHLWVAQRWSRDGQSLYFSTEPYGIGGYILFSGASSLQRINVNDRSIQEVIPYNVGGGPALCLDELSSDERLVADHCAQTSITIRDLSSGQTTTIQPPADVTGFSLVGSARFSPDLTRVAFALAKRDPESEQGWVAVSEGLSGGSKLIVTSQGGEYFTIAAWLNADTLLLQSNQVLCTPDCPSSLWTVGSNGANLTKVAEGTFLTLVSR